MPSGNLYKYLPTFFFGRESVNMTYELLTLH
jgi:hypothetical protein